MIRGYDFKDGKGRSVFSFSMVHVLIGLALISLSLLSGCVGMRDRKAAFDKYMESPTHKAWAQSRVGYGYAYSIDDESSAQIIAMNKCEEHGSTCKVTDVDGLPILEFRLQRSQRTSYAWAVSSDGRERILEWGATPQEAKTKAIARCKAKGGIGCKVTGSSRPRASRRGESVKKTERPAPRSVKKTEQPTPQMESFGTGFFVGKPGYLLTNFHVVADCSVIDVQNKNYKSEARLSDSDPKNDLAGLIVENKNVPAIARFRTGKPIRIGDEITVVGFPLGFVLGTGIKATTGNVSAMTGLLDDVAQMQITAPVQPGNSGGPVLDRSGNVVGIISSKLNEIVVAQVIGSLPQNVNFAIKSTIAQIFLDTNRVDYERRVSKQRLDIADIVEQATKYTAKVQCRADKQ